MWRHVPRPPHVWWGLLLTLALLVASTTTSTTTSKNGTNPITIKSATDHGISRISIKNSAFEFFCIGNCNTTASVPTSGGYFLQGGGLDVDQGFEWMINKAIGGDFLVLRAAGTDAYNPWVCASSLSLQCICVSCSNELEHQHPHSLFHSID